ncbi:hypothetical protein BDZ89DRAFT_1114429 [Hymenopellis radicata]|nr:hypothetical protein BDZ89DRAFT_1114429 [Hymenopellis radicata]
MPSQIDLALGGIVVSTFFSFLTMGVICTCAFQYFSNFPNDKWVFKVLVSLCMIMSTIDTISTGLWCYDWGVTNYGNPAAMAVTHWAFAAEASLLGTCSLFVQWFYAWRIWMVSMKKHWWLSAIIVALSTMAWCVVIWMVHIISTHKMVADLHLVLPVVYIWLGGSCGGRYDYMLHGVLLGSTIPKQDGSKAPAIWRAIIVRTVECNALSLVAQTITVALFNRPNVGFYFGRVLTDMTLSKIYTFSLLVSLNGRHIDGRENSGVESSKGAPENHTREVDEASDSWPKENESGDDYTMRKVKLDMA